MTLAARRRRLAFMIVTALSALSLVAAAQSGGRHRPHHASHAKKHATKKHAKKRQPGATSDGGVHGKMRPKKSRGPKVASEDAGVAGAVVEQRTTDGGARVFRFGEVEVEGRLKSPQIVYFLRRVRAEFAAGDLGHRSFMRELSETRNEPEF